MSQEKEKHKPIFNNTSEFLENCLEKLGWKIDDQKFRLVSKKGHYIKEPELMFLELYDHTYAPDRRYIKLEHMMPLIQCQIHKARMKKWEELKDKMQYGDFEESRSELVDLTHIIVPDSESDKRDVGKERHKLQYLLINFFQQIKHKIILEEDYGYPVVPIFYGSQALGKSDLVKFLTEPFEAFTKKMYVEQITNPDRFYRMLRDKMIIKIEELDGADKANLAVLKSLVTDKEITAHKMYSQNPVEEFCFASFIITSNKPSWEVFRDRSGNRRWGDFLIMTEINLKFLEENIDILKIVQGTPLCNTEYEKTRMRGMSKYLIDDQKESKVQDDIDEFIEEMEICENPLESLNKFISKEDLYDHFKKMRHYDPRPFPKDMTLKKFWLSLKDRLQFKERFGRNKEEKLLRGFRIDLEKYDVQKINKHLSLFEQINLSKY